MPWWIGERRAQHGAASCPIWATGSKLSSASTGGQAAALAMAPTLQKLTQGVGQSQLRVCRCKPPGAPKSNCLRAPARTVALRHLGNSGRYDLRSDARHGGPTGRASTPGFLIDRSAGQVLYSDFSSTSEQLSKTMVSRRPQVMRAIHTKGRVRAEDAGDEPSNCR